MKNLIRILILSSVLASCDSFNKGSAEDLVKLLEKHPNIHYLETNIDILKVNKTYYCDFIDNEIECLNANQVKAEFGCTRDDLDRMFELVRKSGAFAVEINDMGQVVFAKGDFTNNFRGLMYSPTEIDMAIHENYFVMFFITNIEKENGSWYRVN